MEGNLSFSLMEASGRSIFFLIEGIRERSIKNMFSRMFSWSFVVAACLSGLFPAQSQGEEKAAQSGTIAVKVPASSLLMARQETGETRLDRSLSNVGLSIGGKNMPRESVRTLRP